VPAKGGGARRRSDRRRRRARTDPGPRPRFRRPDAETVRWAAHGAIAKGGRAFPSQAALRRALLPVLRRKDPLFALGGRRMRTLLVESPGLHLRVRYAERETRSPLSRCPVCGGALATIRNRTLFDDEVTLGYRCPRCGYWTHLKRRVPVRYVFLPAGVDDAPLRGTDRITGRPSG
jgi:DNA-directed RNA polymerase subunit RPC12/RpoP